MICDLCNLVSSLGPEGSKGHKISDTVFVWTVSDKRLWWSISSNYKYNWPYLRRCRNNSIRILEQIWYFLYTNTSFLPSWPVLSTITYMGAQLLKFPYCMKMKHDLTKTLCAWIEFGLIVTTHVPYQSGCSKDPLFLFIIITPIVYAYRH